MFAILLLFFFFFLNFNALQVVAAISISIILISTVALTLNTIKYFEDTDENGNPVDNKELSLVEAICIAWFTIEYLLRFITSPNKWQFVKGALNIIDVLAILPYYVSLFLLESTEAGDGGSFQNVQRINHIMFFTDKGKCYWLKVHEIPPAGRGQYASCTFLIYQ